MQNDFPRNNQTQQSNWPFLVIAILMAVVLWLFVRTGGQPLGQRNLQLSVTVTNGQNLVVSPRNVEIRLEGSGPMVDRLTPEDVAVIADLAGHKPGDLVTLTVVPPQGFKVLSTTATQVRVVAAPPSAP
jgi:YbbR domain-containing protein